MKMRWIGGEAGASWGKRTHVERVTKLEYGETERSNKRHTNSAKAKREQLRPTSW